MHEGMDKNCIKLKMKTGMQEQNTDVYMDMTRHE